MKIDNLLYGLKDVFLGTSITATLFYAVQEVPNLKFVTLVYGAVLLISAVLFVRSKKGGDDQ